MREEFRRLLLGEAAIHRPGKVVRHLCDLPCGNQGTYGHQAAVPGREVRAQPQVSE